MVQGASEEIMCRGFLETSLKRKVSLTIAVLVSASVLFKHLDFMRGIPEMEKLVAISDLFDISLDELVKGEEPVQTVTATG